MRNARDTMHKSTKYVEEELFRVFFLFALEQISTRIYFQAQSLVNVYTIKIK